MSEQRNFTMHKNLLVDVITRQAGTLDKAILEGVMNLVEARATRGTVTLSRVSLVIEDDGKGFESKQEIIDAFETFGKSDERKAENKTWGRFQMGRGQLMAFGVTTYRTNTFAMTVDIRERGLSYELQENLPFVKGCTITVELYEPISSVNISTITRDVERNVKFVPVPIIFNGERVSIDPDTQKWDEVTDHAYIKKSTSENQTVKIYNLGVYVEAPYMQGAGGTYVSKQQLDVNFARNQVLRNSESWKQIEQHFRERTKKSLLEKKTFSVDDARSVIARFRVGEYNGWNVQSLPLFLDTNGKRRSASRLTKADKIAFDTRGSVKADRAMKSDPTVIILNIDFLNEIFDGDPGQELTRFLLDVLPREQPPAICSIDELYNVADTEYEAVPDSKLNAMERIALNTLRREFGQQGYAFHYGDLDPHQRPQTRHLIIGTTSGSAESWTNGTSYIAFERKYFQEQIKTLSGWTSLLTSIAHSYAHVGRERTHDPEFFERFHDLIDACLDKITTVFLSFARSLEKSGVKAKNLSLTAARISDLDETPVYPDDLVTDKEHPLPPEAEHHTDLDDLPE